MKQSRLEKAAQKQFVVKARPEPKHPRAQVHDALMKLKAMFRRHRTLPADAADSHKPMQEALANVSTPRLPRKHCAFAQCTWEGASEQDRLDHLTKSTKDGGHREVMYDMADALPKWFHLQERVVSMYNEAIAECIREGAPLACYAIDRRALENMHNAITEDSVQAPICFLCGCIYIHFDKPQHDWRPGQASVESDIHWFSVLESNPKTHATEFLGLTEHETSALYGLESYLQKYNTDRKGFLNLRQQMREFDDWIMDVPFGEGRLVRVLCCPEDRHCSSAQCLQGTRICAQCVVPLCRTCKTHFEDRGAETFSDCFGQ